MGMRHLFSVDGEIALVRTMRRGPLLAFDFDGTLTPIVARPDDATLSKGVSARLTALADRLPVAIVTGRSVADVRKRLGFEPRYIVGNHGAEEAGRAAVAAEPSPALDDLRLRIDAWHPALSVAGVTVEDKGHSIALHYRLSRTRELALEAIDELLKGRDRTLRVFGGKLVVNVAPIQARDKADAVRSLLERSGAPCAIFAGDDVNDEPVFATAPADWLTIRVGRDPHSRARFFIDSPKEMTLLLDRMVSLLAP